jgi:hypothetical protein
MTMWLVIIQETPSYPYNKEHNTADDLPRRHFE